MKAHSYYYDSSHSSTILSPIAALCLTYCSQIVYVVPIATMVYVRAIATIINMNLIWVSSCRRAFPRPSYYIYPFMYVLSVTFFIILPPSTQQVMSLWRRLKVVYWGMLDEIHSLKVVYRTNCVWMEKYKHADQSWLIDRYTEKKCDKIMEKAPNDIHPSYGL